MRKFSIRKAAALLTAIAFITAPALAQTLVPGGQSIGVAVKTEGLIVVGTSDVGTSPSPAHLAGIKSGDVITAIDGKLLNEVTDINAMLTGNECRLTCLRDGKTIELAAQPAYDKNDGRYKLGLWVRDSAAGIGTLTFYDPQTGRYGALGHPITDADADIVLPVEEGTIYENSIIGVEKGRIGEPGELLGRFTEGEALGSVEINDEYGIYGNAVGSQLQTLYPDGIETLPKEQLHRGRAEILTTVGDKGLSRYGCEIVSIDLSPGAGSRSFMIRITDKELIETTGGIVQGMSGSPIIQDGKLVGAVTHVLVNSPDTGYGIFIENMLEAAS